MKIKDAYFNTFDYFKNNLNSALTTALSGFKRGFPPNNSDAGARMLFMIGYSGRIDDTSMADAEKEIDLNCFVLLTNSNTMESDIFTLLDEVSEFINTHPTMGGAVDLIEMGDWEIDFAENETTAASLQFKMTAKFH